MVSLANPAPSPFPAGYRLRTVGSAEGNPIALFRPGAVKFRHNSANDQPEESAVLNAESRVSPPAESDLSALIRRMAEGDEHAVSCLYDTTSRVVFSLCVRILADPADAEEVVLDVFTQAWRQAGRYDVLRGEPLSWLLTLAHSRAIDRLRSRAGAKKREQPLEGVAEFISLEPDPESGAAVDQKARYVRKALDCLSREQRQVIELAYFEGLTHVEIANRIQQPLGTAKSRIRLGMAKLRDELSSLQEGWSS